MIINPTPVGRLENYTEKLTVTTGEIDLSVGNVFSITLSTATTFSIINAVDNVAHSFTLIITQPAEVKTMVFPTSVKWRGGALPDMTAVSKTYVLTFMTIDGGSNWLGMFGGDF